MGQVFMLKSTAFWDMMPSTLAASIFVVKEQAEMLVPMYQTT